MGCLQNQAPFQGADSRTCLLQPPSHSKVNSVTAVWLHYCMPPLLGRVLSRNHNNLAVNSSTAQGALYVAVYMQYRSLLEPDFIVEFLGTVE